MIPVCPCRMNCSFIGWSRRNLQCFRSTEAVLKRLLTPRQFSLSVRLHGWPLWLLLARWSSTQSASLSPEVSLRSRGPCWCDYVSVKGAAFRCTPHSAEPVSRSLCPGRFPCFSGYLGMVQKARDPLSPNPQRFTVLHFASGYWDCELGCQWKEAKLFCFGQAVSSHQSLPASHRLRPTANPQALLIEACSAPDRLSSLANQHQHLVLWNIWTNITFIPTEDSQGREAVIHT